MTRPVYWSVRRELWEHRWLYLAPLGAVALILTGYFISLFGLPEAVRAAAALADADRRAALNEPFNMAAFAVIVVAGVASGFYCLVALHGERRDRSQLYWKSLPVTDTTAVLSKAIFPLLLMPVLTIVLGIVVYLLLLVIGSVVLWLNGIDGLILWTHVRLLDRATVLTYGVATQSLWYAPLYAWLLLVSAWAHRLPLLWALGPAAVPVIIERLALGSNHAGNFFIDRLTGSYGRAFTTAGYTGATETAEIDPAKYFSSPDVWLGLIMVAACLATAIWLRRHRQPT